MPRRYPLNRAALFLGDGERLLQIDIPGVKRLTDNRAFHAEAVQDLDMLQR